MFCKLPTDHDESMVNYYASTTLSLRPADRASEVDSNSLEETLYSSSDSSSEEESQSLFQDKVLCGYWGVNRFKKYPWAERNRPYIRTRHYKNLKKLTEEEFQGRLTDRIIGCCLSYLEKSPYDLKYALCKCKLQEKCLVDISALKSYHYIQYLNLSRNCITTLEALSEMPYLQYLDVSFNRIENAFDFKPPMYLTSVNYSGNKIVIIPNLENFWSLVRLDMSYNSIREIRGLGGLKYLTYLNLSHNKIRMLENLNNLNLETVIMRDNNICLFQSQHKDVGFHTLKRLHTVDLSYNKMTTLYFLHQNIRLENIIMANNEISHLMEIFYLKDLQFLKRLNLIKNKITEKCHFHAVCLRQLKCLLYLNEEEVTAEQKLEARTKEDISPFHPPHVSRAQLMLLEAINRPKIAASVCPYDQPHPNVIMVIGPPGSGKRETVFKFVEQNKLLELGVSYTSRTKRANETCGKDYYFVTHHQFVEMIRKAEFISVTEFNGHFYGITHKELEKGFHSILVLFSDLEAALTLRMAGLNPKMVLALPRDESKHLERVKLTYFYHVPHNSDFDEVIVRPCPTCMRPDMAMPSEEDESIEIEEGSCDMSFVMDETYSSVSKSSSSKDKLALSDHESPPASDANLIYKPAHSETSITSYPLEIDSQRLIEKVTLKSEEQFDENAKNKYGNAQNQPEAEIQAPHHSADDTKKAKDTTRSRNDSCLKNDQDELDRNDEEELKNTCEEEFKNIGQERPKNTSGEEIKHSLAGKSVEIMDSAHHILTTSLPNQSVLSNLKKEESVHFLPETYPDQLRTPTSSESLSKRRESLPCLAAKERFSGKRVSFNWLDPANDSLSRSTDESITPSGPRQPLTSISNAHILVGVDSPFDENPLLSVLSSPKITDGSGRPSKTVYTSMSERFDALKTDRLGPFLKYAMNVRKELLELHFQNPGLFHAVIFTDSPKECIATLKETARFITEQMEANNKFYNAPSSFENHPDFQAVIQKRLNETNLHENPFIPLYDELQLRQ